MPINDPLMFAITVPVLIVVTLYTITDVLEHRIYTMHQLVQRGGTLWMT